MAKTRPINYRIVHLLGSGIQLWEFNCARYPNPGGPASPAGTPTTPADSDNFPTPGQNGNDRFTRDAIFLPAGTSVILVKAGTGELIKIGPFQGPAIVRWVPDGTPQGKLEIYNCLVDTTTGDPINTQPEWCAAVASAPKGQKMTSYPCADAENFEQYNPPPSQVPMPSA